MKKYVRTENGLFWEYDKKLNRLHRTNDITYCDLNRNPQDFPIDKTSNKVEDLIKVGDTLAVRYNGEPHLVKIKNLTYLPLILKKTKLFRILNQNRDVVAEKTENNEWKIILK